MTEPDWNTVAYDLLKYGAANIEPHHAVSALRAAYALGQCQATEWRPIAEAPRDEHLPWEERTVVLIYAAARDDLPAFQTTGKYHDDAGWCVDELRHATHYQPLPPAPETKE